MSVIEQTSPIRGWYTFYGLYIQNSDALWPGLRQMEPGTMMAIQWIEDDAGFDGLRKDWDTLLAQSSSNCVFLTWEWLRTWWNHLAERRALRIAVVRRGEELVALAPLAIRLASLRRLFPFRSVEFLGTGTVGSDYLDLIVRRDAEDEALNSLSRAFGRDLMLEFGQLRDFRSQSAELDSHLQQQGWKSARVKVNVCPFIDLRGHSWTSYLGTLGSEHRYNVQRKIKNLSKKFEVTFEQVEREDQRSEALNLLISLHHKRWTDRGGGSDAFHTPGHLAFHEEFTALALSRGWLRLYVLRLDGQPASALYGLRYGSTFSFYQSGFDPQYARHSVGLVTMGLAIKSAIEEGAGEYDLLHGNEAYKSHWAHESRDLVRLNLYPPGVRGQCLRAVSNGGSLVRGWLRQARQKWSTASKPEVSNLPPAGESPIPQPVTVAAIGKY